MDKKKFVWSCDKTYLIIEKQENYPELWDTSSNYYKNKSKRRSAVKAIAYDMGAPVEEVKRKLHNLRTQFAQEVNKERKKRSGQSAEDVAYVSKWEFYNAMKYMTSPHVPKETKDNLGVQDVKKERKKRRDQNAEEVYVTQWEYYNDMKYRTSTHTPEKTVDNLELPITLDNDAYITDQSEEVQSVSRKRRKRTNSEKDEHDVLLENALQLMQKPTDEYQIFGDFVASELRGLRKPGSKRKLKRLIQQAILKVTDEDDEANSDSQLLGSDANGLENSTSQCEADQIEVVYYP